MKLLIEGNIAVLEQARSAVICVDDAAYVQPAAGTDLRIGPHIRHIIEFYRCFFSGVHRLHVDYDCRPRDPQIERDRSAAVAAIDDLIGQLESTVDLRQESILHVRSDSDAMLLSSIGRELQTLQSHTVHHLALVAIALRCFGFDVHPAFGVAPSTLRHRKAA
jgi:hypothetical protein